MVLKNYKPIDTENIMKQLHNGKVVSEKSVEPSLSQIPSVAHRRRQSMMDNTNYKFAYSRKKLILHDKDCELVKHIPDEDFEMLTTFDSQMVLCSACYRKMLVRAVVVNQSRKINLYVKAFDRLCCGNKKLRKLLFDHKAQLIDVDPNSLTIIVNKDKWLFQFHSDKLELYHNNYVVNDDLTRTFTPGFHLQSVYREQRYYGLALSEIISYSWNAHLKKEKNTAGSSYYEELKSKFDTVKNYKQIKDSKYHITFQLIDYNYQALRFISGDEIVVNIRGPLPCDFIGRDEPFAMLQCRVRKSDVSAFKHAMKLLKDHAFSNKEYEYIEVCQTMEAEL